MERYESGDAELRRRVRAGLLRGLRRKGLLTGGALERLLGRTP